MGELQINSKIEMVDGCFVTVTRLLGSGGQGEVYLVKDANGHDYALKWYTSPTIKQDHNFRNNLAYNIKQGAPNKNFLWPLKLTKFQNGSYGYLMALRPSRFNELGEMACVKRFPNSYFKSLEAKINAAIQICDAFRSLHLHGFSYQDLNEGGFFIDFSNGDVMICDNDNVIANGMNMGVRGKVRYMAAEVVEGGMPTIQSDCLSLAIILYRIFMVDHPLEGALTLKYPNMTPEIERALFGRQAVFCYDPVDASNRPVPGQDVNSIKFWKLISPALRAMFQKALGKNAIQNPTMRVKVKEWKDFFLKLRRKVVVCPADGRDKPNFMFMADSTPTVCPKCRKTVQPAAQLTFKTRSGDETWDFYLDKHLYLGDSCIPVGYGVSRKKDDGTEEIAIRNLSQDKWTLLTASRKTITVEPNMAVPLRTGMELYFNSTYSCNVKLP